MAFSLFILFNLFICCDKIIMVIVMIKKNNNMLVYYVCLNIINLVFGMLLKTYKVIDYKMFSYSLIFFMLINLFIVFYLIRNKYKKSNADIFIILCFLFSLISTVFSKNFEWALYGSTFRHEGFLMLLYYYSLIFISSYIDKDKKAYVYKTVIFAGLFQAIYSIIQSFDLFKFIKIMGRGYLPSRALVTNSNFLSTFLLISICYTIYVLIDKINLKYYFIYIVLLISFILANTLSGVIALLFVFLIFFIYYFRNKRYIYILFFVIPFIVLLVVMSNNNYSTLLNDLLRTNKEIIDISSGNVNNNFGSGRLFVWKESLKAVPKYWLHGSGVDNFYMSFDRKLFFNNQLYDRAHNEMLNLLVTEGFFALLSYIGLLFVSCFDKFIKFVKDNDFNIYFIVVIAYLIQSMFNIRVIEVAPIFYISLGLLIERKDK